VATAASWRNFLIQVEYYQIGLTQSRLPGVPSPKLGFNGGYVEGGWVMTGEPIPYNVDRPAWSRPKVYHPFSLEDGGIGAWEIAARYSTVDLNSKRRSWRGIVNLAARGMLVVSLARRLGSGGPLLAYYAVPL
jgi:phosphate-selective porin OprO/OprP